MITIYMLFILILVLLPAIGILRVETLREVYFLLVSVVVLTVAVARESIISEIKRKK